MKEKINKGKVSLGSIKIGPAKVIGTRTDEKSGDTVITLQPSTKSARRKLVKLAEELEEKKSQSPKP